MATATHSVADSAWPKPKRNCGTQCVSLLDVEARYFLGALLVQQGQNEEGAKLLKEVQVARPDLWGTAYYLGKAQLSMGKPAAALPLLSEAARRAPNEAPVQYQLARTLQSLGRKAEAAQAFARVSRLQAANNPESIVMK